MHRVSIEEDAYFSHCDPDNPFCVRTMEINRLDFHRWLDAAVREEHLDEVDAETHQTTIAQFCGVGTVSAGSSLEAVMLLRRMPICFGLQLELCHLDMPRLKAIYRVLASLTDEELLAIDEPLALLLTPKRAGEVLVGPTGLERRVRDIMLATVDGHEPTPKQERFLDIRNDDQNEGNMLIDGSIDAASGRALKKSLKRIMKAQDCTRAEAFAMFVQDRCVEKVVVNLFAPDNLEDVGFYVPGSGFLDREDTKLWADMVGHYRDATAYAEEVIAGYNFGERLGEFSRFRDGECQVPNCNRAVDSCDIDHTVNHRDSGPTSPSNSGCLCRPHHSMKSFGLLAYERDAETGTITWRMPDGSKAVTMENGTVRIFTRSYGAKRRARIERSRQ